MLLLLYYFSWHKSIEADLTLTVFNHSVTSQALSVQRQKLSI